MVILPDFAISGISAITSFARIYEKNSLSQGFSLDEIKDILVDVKKASGEKCKRCWKISKEVSNNSDICIRCNEVLTKD